MTFDRGGVHDGAAQAKGTRYSRRTVVPQRPGSGDSRYEAAIRVAEWVGDDPERSAMADELFPRGTLAYPTNDILACLGRLQRSYAAKYDPVFRRLVDNAVLEEPP